MAAHYATQSTSLVHNLVRPVSVRHLPINHDISNWKTCRVPEGGSQVRYLRKLEIDHKPNCAPRSFLNFPSKFLVRGRIHIPLLSCHTWCWLGSAAEFLIRQLTNRDDSCQVEHATSGNNLILSTNRDKVETAEIVVRWDMPHAVTFTSSTSNQLWQSESSLKYSSQ